MAIDQGLLYRVQFIIGSRQAFYRDELFTIQRRQELNTGIDGAKFYKLPTSIKLSQHDRARAAISLGTALLGAGSMQVFPEELQHSAGWINVMQLNDFTIKNEPHRIRASCRRFFMAAHNRKSPPGANQHLSRSIRIILWLI